MTAAITAAIRKLNDQYRRYWMVFPNSHVAFSEGIARLSGEDQKAIARKVQTFDAFEGDPHDEHEFGSFDYRGTKIFWKIDTYNPSLTGGAVDASDVFHTARVLTIMLACEY